MIARECMELKAFVGSDSLNGSDSTDRISVIQFKSCPNNNWVHYRYREQDDLVIGVMCAYLWDWERYENDLKLRTKKTEPEPKDRPLITLFIQVHGNLYREMKQNNEEMVEINGYEIPGKFCHVIDYDIDMSNMPEKYSRKGELASLLIDKLHSANCHILEVAEKIYTKYLQSI